MSCSILTGREAVVPEERSEAEIVHIGALALVFVMLLGIAPFVSAQGVWERLLTGFESSIGGAVVRDVHEQFGPPIGLPRAEQLRVDTIFANVVLQAERRDIVYTLHVLDSETINAFAAPGGYIFLTTGLLRHVGDDPDALANVLGHEVAHVEHKHGIHTLGRNLGLDTLMQLVFGQRAAEDEVWQVIAGVSVRLMQLGWSRSQEYASDDLGQRLAADAGYDPEGMVRFFHVLRQLEGEETPLLQFLSTHPLTSERMRKAADRAAALSGRSAAALRPTVSRPTPLTAFGPG